MQKSMKNHHVLNNGWNDIGQHFSIFPDGSILTGRSLEKSPACITGQNANSICIESVGNFDIGGDVMSPEQKDSIVSVTASLCERFGIPATSDRIVYHHWFNLSTGERNNGTKNNKSCPGTNFFGGNKVKDCESEFLPLVRSRMEPKINPVVQVQKYAYVDTQSLNIRMGAYASSPRADGGAVASFGSILRVYSEKDGWLKISANSERWVSGKFTREILKCAVSADSLNVRSGPGTNFPAVARLAKGEEVFVSETDGGWSRLGPDARWVSTRYLRQQ